MSYPEYTYISAFELQLPVLWGMTESPCQLRAGEGRWTGHALPLNIGPPDGPAPTNPEGGSAHNKSDRAGGILAVVEDEKGEACVCACWILPYYWTLRCASGCFDMTVLSLCCLKPIECNRKFELGLKRTVR